MIFYKTCYANTTDDVDVLSIIHECKFAILESQSTDGLLTVVSPNSGVGFTVMPNIPEAIDEMKASIDIFGGEAGEAKDRLKRDRAIGPIVQSAVMGRTIHIPFKDGVMLLDPYDEVFLFDFDHKKSRREFIIQIISESPPAQQGAGQGGQ